MASHSSPAARCAAFVALCGATIAPVGDHFHVARGVTEYLTDFGPIWLGESPLWFVGLVTWFMASLAFVRVRWLVSDRRPGASVASLLAPLAVLALYLTTSFYPYREGGTLEALMTTAAVVMFVGLDRSWRGLAIGVAVATVATATELLLVHLGMFRYLPQSDELWGVAPWLLPLYFAASVAIGAVAGVMSGACGPG